MPALSSRMVHLTSVWYRLQMPLGQIDSLHWEHIDCAIAASVRMAT